MEQKYKTIIAGSREVDDLNIVRQAMSDINFEPSVIISGTARGVDQLGEMWAEENNIPILRFPANWEKFGKSAGYKRNIEMAKNADALVAIWDGVSKGTRHMIDIAVKYKLKIHIHRTDETDEGEIENE